MKQRLTSEDTTTAYFAWSVAQVSMADNGGNTILNQPYRRRVTTDRLNRDGSQLAASLEGEPGPTPTGKTLPQHSYLETRFWRERARGV